MKPSALPTIVELEPQPPAGRWYVVASVLIALHLLAVWTAPFSVGPSSPLAGSMQQVMRPYLDAMFLNHGYKFFAPDPGPGQLIRYELEMPDGSTVNGRFPDLKQQWPRLLYHRHLMLSDRTSGPPEAPWIQAYARSFAQHLLKRHGARKATLYQVTHALPAPHDVLAGMKLDDPVLYRERRLISLSGDTRESGD